LSGWKPNSARSQRSPARGLAQRVPIGAPGDLADDDGDRELPQRAGDEVDQQRVGGGLLGGGDQGQRQVLAGSVAGLGQQGHGGGGIVGELTDRGVAIGGEGERRVRHAGIAGERLVDERRQRDREVQRPAHAWVSQRGPGHVDGETGHAQAGDRVHVHRHVLLQLPDAAGGDGVDHLHRVLARRGQAERGIVAGESAIVIAGGMERWS
jgi:hypothetical protein